MSVQNLNPVLVRLRGFPDVQLGVGASEAELIQAEAKLGLSIPAPYRDFLRRFGWARIGREEIHGLGADVPASLDLVQVTLRERNKSQPRLRHDFLPIRHDGEGNFDCIYLGGIHGVQNPVVLWEHEEGPQQIPGQIAASFFAWLSLRLDELVE